MDNRFSPLFEPFTLNNAVTIDNRLVVAPMTHYSSHDDGSLSDEERAFLAGRATGFGMFITAATLVSPEGKAFTGQPYAFRDAHLPSLTETAALIKGQGAKAILQIHHGGDRAIVDGAVSPSGTGTTRALADNDIQSLVTAFGKAAALAIDAGFDGVEIHGANGYLLQQFFSAQSNQRTDRWGGSLQNRMRFPLAVVDAVVEQKRRAGRDDFIIGYRFSPEEAGDQGLTMADTFALVDALVQKPLQYLHVSLWDFHRKARRGADTSLTRIELLHRRIAGRLPLIGVGCLLSADQVLQAHETGWAEFIAVGKAVMINPSFALLVRHGDTGSIATAIDPAHPERYRYPANLWQQQLRGLAYLPPLKDRDWQSVNI